jgi:catechol-2,3-dioxygenase
MSAPAPRLNGVLETALYVDDLSRAASFYEETFGLSPLSQDERLCALDCGPASVLLLFARGATSEAVKLPGGEIPAHDGSGRLHVAFAVAKEDLPAWERRLTERGVEIEARMNWPAGGESLYFRDPDGNLGEIATPGLWKNY